MLDGTRRPAQPIADRWLHLHLICIPPPPPPDQVYRVLPGFVASCGVGRGFGWVVGGGGWVGGRLNLGPNKWFALYTPTHTPTCRVSPRFGPFNWKFERRPRSTRPPYTPEHPQHPQHPRKNPTHHDKDRLHDDICLCRYFIILKKKHSPQRIGM